MSRTRRLGIILAVKASVLVLLWFLFPTPFVRGLIAGVILTLGLIVGGALFIGKLMRTRVGSDLPPPPLPTKSWDYSMDLTDLSGTPVNASQFSGQVLVLNFWATWCVPCVAEMPSLQRLREETSGLDLRFALVTREPSQVVQRFEDEHRTGLPIYLLAGEVPDCFQSRAIPATFILDRSGRIVMRHFGAAKWDDAGVVAYLKGLAAMPNA